MKACRALATLCALYRCLWNEDRRLKYRGCPLSVLSTSYVVFREVGSAIDLDARPSFDCCYAGADFYKVKLSFE